MRLSVAMIVAFIIGGCAAVYTDFLSPQSSVLSPQ
jgi:hypothetical protein